MNPQRLRRLTRFQIVFHWLVAVPYIALMSSGALMLLQRLGLSAHIPRPTLATVHRWVGLGLLAAIAFVFIASVLRGQLVRLVKDILSPLWLRLRDCPWLIRLPLNVLFPRRFPLPPAGQFNAGQKLHTLFVTAALGTFGSTGIMIMARPADLRPWLVHSWLFVGAVAFLLLHLFLALINPPTRPALRGVFTGFVSRRYVEEHHALTLAEPVPAARPHRIVGLWTVAVTLTFGVLALAFIAHTYEPTQALAQVSRQSLLAVLPGPLTAAHGDDPRTAQCQTCHQGFKPPSNSACLACHTEIATVMRQGLGYHGQLTGSCAACHPDHHGREADLRALDARTFNHRLARFTLQGQHNQVDCDACHVQHSGVPGQRRFVQLQFTACRDCHANAHQDARANDCAHCHNERGWTGREVHFDHQRDTTFHLDGQHARVSCDECHTPGRADTTLASALLTPEQTPLRAIKSLPACGTPKPIPFVLTEIGSTCSDCHADPHQPSLGDDCKHCHATGGWTGTALLFRHDRDSTFHLQGAHAQVECRGCHTPPGNEEPLARARFTGLSTRCDGCHRDPHAGQLGHECTQCHTESGWTGRQLLFQHDRGSSFPLRGRHAQVTCAQCHLPRSSGADAAAMTLGGAKFTGTPTECSQCHADPHRGQMDKNCSACHTEQGWRRPQLVFDHNRDSRFKIDAIHSNLQCAACHQTSQDLTIYRPLGTSCEACHRPIAEAMAGKLDGESVRADPHLGCVQCVDCHPTQTRSLNAVAMADRCVQCHNPRYRPLYFDWQRALDERSARVNEQVALLRRSNPAEANALARQLAQARTIGIHNVEVAAERLDRLAGDGRSSGEAAQHP